MSLTRLAAASAAAALLASGCERETAVEAPSPERVEAALDEARLASQALGGELVSALNAALADSGPSGAIPVCREQAPAIAARISAHPDVEIGRTALKLRNPANAPDAWEAETLEVLAAEIAAGASPATLERYVIEPDGADWRMRWMKPIVLRPMCATCHGTDVDPALLDEIRAAYPEDDAVGFTVGELRGAFTATVKIAD